MPPGFTELLIDWHHGTCSIYIFRCRFSSSHGPPPLAPSNPYYKNQYCSPYYYSDPPADVVVCFEPSASHELTNHVNPQASFSVFSTDRPHSFACFVEVHCPRNCSRVPTVLLLALRGFDRLPFVAPPFVLEIDDSS